MYVGTNIKITQKWHFKNESTVEKVQKCLVKLGTYFIRMGILFSIKSQDLSERKVHVKDSFWH